MDRGRSTSSKKTSWLLLTVLAVLAVVAMACGGTDTGDAVSRDVAPAEQQVLRVRINSEPRTLDPHRSNLSVESSVNKSLFTALFTYDEELKIVPALAADVPTEDNGGVSEDGMTYTIRLIEGTKWSDGSPLTADDFVYSMKRALDPRTASPYASYFFSVQGAREFATAMGTPQQPKSPSESELAVLMDRVGVSATDARTIVYRLADPNPSFLNQLAVWTAFPVKKDVVERWGERWTEPEHHVGNGPFVLAGWEHGERILLRRNENWSGKEKPVLSRIEVNIIADDAAAYAAYLAGELDSVTVPASARREVASSGSPLSSQLRRQPELGTFAMFMNQAMKPFDNVKVRQAFAMAIDRDSMVEGVLQGAGRPTTSWIPPGMPGYNAGLGRNLEYNSQEAREALAEAGYKDGAGFPEVTFLFAAVDTNRVMGQFVQDQLKRNLGVDVKLDFVEGPVFGQRFVTNQHQVTIIRWGAEWPYPDNWLPGLFMSNAGNNHTGYASATFDEIMRKAASRTSDSERLSLYEAGHKMILDEAVISPLFNRESYVVTKPWVKNLILTGLDGFVGGDYHFAKTYIVSH
jgi:oligopeptide transport system substrate-binding protein